MPHIDRRERVPLLEARGRVLAADVVAAADVPPFDRASMDGYAVIAADTAGATREQPASTAPGRTHLHRRRADGRRGSLARASRSRPARRCPTAPTP